MTAPAPGLYPGVPEAAYRSWDAVSQSHLHDLVARTPMHAHYAYTHPQEPTGAMAFGSAAHIICLEPDRLEREYQCAPEGLDRRSKEGKARWAAMLADGREPMKFDEYHALATARDAVYAHPTASALLAGKGLNEVSLVWDDYGASGDDDLPPLRCKARWDRLTTADDWPTIVDLKFVEDATPRWLPWKIGDYCYGLQASMYLRAGRMQDRLAGRAPVDRRFVFVFVEKAPPHGIACVELDAASLVECDEQLRAAMELWARCTASGHWPGYPAGIAGVSLPEKFWRREE
jgi:hypothetical protein